MPPLAQCQGGTYHLEVAKLQIFFHVSICCTKYKTGFLESIYCDCPSVQVPNPVYVSK